MVVTSLLIGQVILLEASLSFLGLGLPPGDPAWGIMVAEGRSVILNVWWLSLLPGLAITIVVLAFNFFGDWMRDALDPKLLGSRGPEDLPFYSHWRAQGGGRGELLADAYTNEV